jgi:hypothetical protein
VNPSPIQVVPAGSLYRLTRLGARYVIRRSDDEHVGAWLPDGEALSAESRDEFTEDEARALLPLLRAMEGRAAGKGGRTSREPTTVDGKLIAHTCKRLGLTVVALAEAIGAHESVLSRARSGKLPAKHRAAIEALLAIKPAKK